MIIVLYDYKSQQITKIPSQDDWDFSFRITKIEKTKKAMQQYLDISKKTSSLNKKDSTNVTVTVNISTNKSIANRTCFLPKFSIY